MRSVRVATALTLNSVPDTARACLGLVPIARVGGAQAAAMLNGLRLRPELTGARVSAVARIVRTRAKSVNEGTTAIAPAAMAACTTSGCVSLVRTTIGRS